MGSKKHWTRRNLLGAGGTVSAALMLNPLLATAVGEAARKRQIKWANWGGNHRSQPSHIAAPQSEEEVVDFMRTLGGPVRPVGSGHSWSGLVPTDHSMLTLDRLKGVVSHDEETLQAEVWAGTKLFAYGPMMEDLGQAIVNMSDVNYQTMAGAISTSTHGTGAALGSMSSYVIGLQLVTPRGEVLELHADNEKELFNAARTGLGSLGVITRLRFQNREKHRLHQQEWLADIDEVLEDIEPLIRDNQQFELFPIPHSRRTIVVVTNEAEAGAADNIEDDPGALNDLRKVFDVTRKLPAGEDFIYNNVLDYAFGDTKHRIGPSYKVLAHPRTVRFMEMEYTVPADQGVACLREVLATIKAHAPEVSFPLEYRYIKGDDTMIGMFSERDGCAISVHQFADEPRWRDYFALVEPVFHKYQGRPHWGKWHSLRDKDLAVLYPRWEEFKQIRRELDPEGRMLNPYLREIFGEP
ncbi:D-arabinono-1,4-lactone oxidase [Pseudohalioglobus lutimaris]|uniref:FAD-linked oxidoreductase n=1 Tax=Pseudohalioglobus lutimaris TaxID=1737061 RepID=A0A2N5X4F6_9GAMM|nr:D-arabinono-1,4-lactone oxidase [Pseudohalioglobus lutimaris]PLW69374.1 FAD-linked oxidoreductase [Pseudohalioglobus lutimaris]